MTCSRRKTPQASLPTHCWVETCRDQFARQAFCSPSRQAAAEQEFDHNNKLHCTCNWNFHCITAVHLLSISTSKKPTFPSHPAEFLWRGSFNQFVKTGRSHCDKNGSHCKRSASTTQTSKLRTKVFFQMTKSKQVTGAFLWHWFFFWLFTLWG